MDICCQQPSMGHPLPRRHLRSRQRHSPTVAFGFGSVALATASLALPALPAAAAPVVCTTTLEAPAQGGRPGVAAAAGPVEVTRCGVVETTDALVDRRAFTWRSSFARGVSLTHQITDILGIAMGGSDGNTVMGLGFPDQAIIWDGSAIQNITAALLEEQGSPIPWRSGDLPNQFTSSLQTVTESSAIPISQSGGFRPSPGQFGGPGSAFNPRFTPADAPIRGLW
jgi:hypothetical protein